MKLGTKRFDEITILFLDKDIRFSRFFGSIKYDPIIEAISLGPRLSVDLIVKSECIDASL